MRDEDARLLADVVAGVPLFTTKKGEEVSLPLPLAPLADTHGHLTSFRRRDPAHAILRAALAGVRLLVVPVDPVDDVEEVGEFLSWFEGVVERAARLLAALEQRGIIPPVPTGFHELPALTERVFLVAGIHPYGAKAFCEDRSVQERLLALLDSPRCVGVGEFGVDFGPWNKLGDEIQERAFRLQLRVAHERGLPVELHLRDAEGDAGALGHALALRVLEEEGVPSAGCDLHCFTSGPEVMAPFVELGCHIAFGGAATFGRSDDIRRAACLCPQELMLSETDSPYMAPMPLRGTECEPALVAFTVDLLSRVREEEGVGSREMTYRALWENANRFFGLT